jgi:hypothetical protein
MKQRFRIFLIAILVGVIGCESYEVDQINACLAQDALSAYGDRVFLGSFKDGYARCLGCPGEIAIDNLVLSESGEDWFELEIRDRPNFSFQAHLYVKVFEAQEDHDSAEEGDSSYEVTTWFECPQGDTEITCLNNSYAEEDGCSDEWFEFSDGAGGWASPFLAANCTGTNDSGRAFIRVRRLSGDSCEPYNLRIYTGDYFEYGLTSFPVEPQPSAL